MNTRIEVINGYTYCAYCGRELKNPHYGICPEPPMICNCELAKEELNLYTKLKELYNSPLAESLIEKKVQKYRNELLGIKEPLYINNNITSLNYVDTLSTKETTSVISITGWYTNRLLSSKGKNIFIEYNRY